MKQIIIDGYTVTQFDDLQVVIRKEGVTLSRFKESEELTEKELTERLSRYKLLASMYDDERKYSGLIDD